MMKFKLISCEVLTREVAYCIMHSPNMISPVFTAKGDHNAPGRLREKIQGFIDAVEEEEEEPYNAVLLGFGLCGNATMGLRARSLPLVIPRAHDCTTLFLGSKDAFREHFAHNPSQSWASVGYSERGSQLLSDSRTRMGMGTGTNQTWEELVETYGEENAEYLLEALQPNHGSSELLFLDVPETRVEALKARIREEADNAGLEYRELVGSIRLIDGLLAGDWSEEDYLIIPPGQQLDAVYDLDEVMRAKPADKM